MTGPERFLMQCKSESDCRLERSTIAGTLAEESRQRALKRCRNSSPKTGVKDALTSFRVARQKSATWLDTAEGSLCS